ncbi:MAG: PKD domain-containing protein [Bacteroidales bacterium]|nr:PKD domain-containing protein [Bacteroidales bacterium]
MIKQLLLIPIFVAITALHIYAQCNVTAYANGGTNTVEICLGDNVTLTATGGCPNYVLNNDFNDGTPGTGWAATNQAMFNNPCSPHSPDGTIYLWMGSTSTAPRNLTTVDFDVSMGGDIEFEMRYAVQSAASPCEGPDLYNEGIAVQYSLNGGSSWTTIAYYAPNGNILTTIPTATSPGVTGVTPFTVWTTQTLQIPVAAQTTSTRFRWAQTVSTSEVYDHWGLDNVSILVPPPTIEIWWAHGPTGYNPPVISPTTTTTYTVYLTDQSDTVQSSVEVFVHPIPTSDFTVQSPVCVGSPSTITYTGSASASANYSWNFDGGTVLSGTGAGPYQVFWNDPGTHNITLSLMEYGCQSTTTTVPILINPKPAPPVITYNPPCENDDLELTTTTVPGGSYAWTGPSGLTSSQQNPIINNVTQANHAGNYSLMVTDSNGCQSDIVTQNVTILSLPIVTFSGTPTSGCVPLTVNFTNSTAGSTSYFWEFGDNGVETAENPTHIYNQSGTFDVTLTATDNNGCTNSFTNNDMIVVHPIPQAEFTTNPEVGAPGFPIVFNSTYNAAVGTWYWNFGDGTTESFNVPTTQHAYTTMGSYTVQHIVESQYGCKDTIEKQILVISITIPNVFTPNGDGINDFFIIDGIGVISETNIIVYNRWGRKVYESSDYKNDWDGADVADGVYYFIITFKDNLFPTANGTVTILR